MLSELIQNYEIAYQEAEDKRNKLIAEHKYKEANDVKSPWWFTEVIHPLAEEFKLKTGMHCEVVGPCGICCKVDIYLYNDPKTNKWDQEHWHLTIEPDFYENELWFRYETGELVNEYAPNTIGAINGMNNVTKPMPPGIDAILSLFKKREPWHKTQL